MSAARTTLALRRRVGLAGGLFLALALLLLLDGMSAGLRRHDNTFLCLPGQSLPISANVPMYVDSPEQVSVQEAPPGVRLRVDQVMAGYVMGGRLFAGAVEVGPQTAPGDHALILTFPPDDKGKVYTVPYTVRVFPDLAAMQAQSPYFLERWLGLTPYPLAGAALALGLGCLGLVFLLSFRLERQLAEEGKAEVYKFKRLDQGLELEFALGQRHGLAPGDHVLLLGEDMQALGQALVTDVRERASTATAEPLAGLNPNCFVSLRAA